MRRLSHLLLTGLAGLVLGLVALPLPLRAGDPVANPEGNTGVLKPAIETGGSIDAHSGNASRMIEDLRVPGALGAYGLSVVRYWESLGATRQANDGMGLPHGFGGWTNNWNLEASMTSEWFGGDGAEVGVKISFVINTRDGRTVTFTNGRGDTLYHGTETAGPPYSGQFGPNTPPQQVWVGSGNGEWVEEVDPNGRWFWLKCKDGGAILYRTPNENAVAGSADYRAVEIRDPNGIPTFLIYEGEYLIKAVEAGGRTLRFTWDYRPGIASKVLISVGWSLSEADPQIVQSVTYSYGASVADLSCDPVDPDLPALPPQPPCSTHTLAVLTSAQTQGDVAAAAYTYRFFTPASRDLWALANLQTADDPRFAGPMQKIRYVYAGQGYECPTGRGPNPYTGSNSSDFRADFYAVREEQIFDAAVNKFVMVARLSIPCNGTPQTGTRTETNGLFSNRKFWYGPMSGSSTTLLSNWGRSPITPGSRPMRPNRHLRLGIRPPIGITAARKRRCSTTRFRTA